MMEKTQKLMSVIELPVYPGQWQIDRINKKMENCARIYNQLRSCFLKNYNELTKTKDFKDKSNLIYTLKDLTNEFSEVKAFHERRCEGYKLDKDENKEKKEKGLRDYEKLKKEKLSDIEFLIRLRKLPLSAEIYLDELKKVRDGLSSKDKKEYEKKIKELYKERNEVYKELGFTQFGIISLSLKFGKYYYNSVPSNMCKLSVAQPLWSSIEKFLYKNGDKITYKRFEFSNSIATNGKSGMMLKEKNGNLFLILSNQNKAKKMEIKIAEPKNDYEKEMLLNPDREIKIIRLVRRMEKSKYHYYVQFTITGAPYIKTKEDGTPIHKVGSEVVGLSLWRGNLYAVSDSRVKKFNLSEGQEAFSEKRDHLAREIEKNRRENNPQNYNEDGTIKKGIVVDGVKQRLEWYNSVKYKELCKEKRELERKNRVNRDLLHRKIAYELLEMGSSFIFTQTSLKTNKPEFDEENPLSNSEYRKKKERRVSIQENAPYDLKEKLNLKLSAYGLPSLKEIKIPDKLYWYRFDTDSQDRDALNGEYITLLGKTCPHTAYKAYIVRYYDETKGKYDQEAIADNWDNFVSNCMA